MLHIVQYSLPQMLTGYTVRTQAIVREQRELGFDPVVVTSPRHPSDREEEVEGVFHHRCPPERRGRSAWLRDAARVRALTSRIQEIAALRGDIGLLHAHSPALCGIAALRAGRRLGLPVVYEVRGLWEVILRGRGPLLAWWPRYQMVRVAETRVCQAADAVVTISDGLRQEFVDRGVPGRSVHVIENGVDPRVFVPREVPMSWRGERSLAQGPLILYLGGLRKYEGIGLLCDAFPAVQQRHPAAQLLIVGDGEAREYVEARARASSSRIHLLPPIPHRETPDYYAAADLVAYPRLSDPATERVTPLKPLEAMAMAKAIVASDVGGLQELLCDRETARLFAAGSAAAFAEVCCELLADKGAQRQLGENARKVACTRFDWRVVVPKYREVYRAAGCDGHSGGS